MKTILKNGTIITPVRKIENGGLVLKNSRIEKVFESEEEKELAQAEIKRNKRKVNYFDDVLTSKSTYLITQIAKELGMSGRALNKKLNELQIQYKQGGVWLLYADYQDRNYTKTRTTRYLNREGEILTKMYTVWTESGRRFIHTKLRQQRNKRIR
jgi:anti-repressor protein